MTPEAIKDPDVFASISDMRARGWRVDWNFFPKGSLGYGCVNVTVSKNGVVAHAVSQTLGPALDRAMKRWLKKATG